MFHRASPWLHYRIHLGSRLLIDEFLTDHLPSTLAGIARLAGPPAWFYLRFIDEFGMHLRLRVQVPLRCISAVDGLIDGRTHAFLSRKANEPTAGTAAHLGFSRSVYAPETRKYRGEGGVQHAEQLFQLGSNTALTLMPYAASQRLLVTRAHLEMLTSLLPEPRRRAFVHQYAWYWSHGPHGRAPGYADHLDALLDSRPAAARSCPEPVQATLASYTQQCQTHLDEAVAAQPLTPKPYLLFHHVHLMHNRLGVTPLEEALTARALWRALTGTKESHE
ncbi:hypothetical protein BIV23_29025 [Streptomyces monashensis]|uniref:Thiopeptide-type bacteriocin biosynthesis domain-containing protein n=1 Tax=Streptomyces monashensis TaxID=1678012 RepID=A0A1S2PZZ2_9ACTN|nr:hypothetical protein BIV23_29025 [Streptomyces monashensis]